MHHGYHLWLSHLFVQLRKTEQCSSNVIQQPYIVDTTPISSNNHLDDLLYKPYITNMGLSKNSYYPSYFLAIEHSDGQWMKIEWTSPMYRWFSYWNWWCSIVIWNDQMRISHGLLEPCRLSPMKRVASNHLLGRQSIGSRQKGHLTRHLDKLSVHRISTIHGSKNPVSSDGVSDVEFFVRSVWDPT